MPREVRLFEQFQTDHGYLMFVSVTHRRWEYARVLKCIGEHVLVEGSCLEIGASAGIGEGTPMAPALALAGYKATTTDLNVNAEIAAKQQNERFGISIECFMQDATSMSFPNESFDCVYSISVIEHIPNDEKALTECMRVLKPGGLFVFTTDFMPNSKIGGRAQLRFYTPQTLKESVFPTLLKAGGTPIDIPDYTAKELNVLFAGSQFNFAMVAVRKQ